MPTVFRFCLVQVTILRTGDPPVSTKQIKHSAFVWKTPTRPNVSPTASSILNIANEKDGGRKDYWLGARHASLANYQ
jgi:hypothetical protein